MPLIVLLISYFLIKLLLLIPFYFRYLKQAVPVAALTSMALAPLMSMLYHETETDFWFVYAAMILLDILGCYFLVQKVWWKAILSAWFINTVLIIFFYIAEG